MTLNTNYTSNYYLLSLGTGKIRDEEGIPSRAGIRHISPIV